MKSVVETELGPDRNGLSEEWTDATRPYCVNIEITGDCDLIFHRYQCEAVEEKSRAAKGSRSKKTDNIESYVYRNDKNELCIPGEYLRQSVIHAAKYRQDPRSPRKSAVDLVKAGLVCLTPLASLGKVTWDYEHKCRAQVQRNAVSRVRPAIKSGWSAEFVFMVNLPEYISPELLRWLLVDAGRLIGVADFRPTYGRFTMTRFTIEAR